MKTSITFLGTCACDFSPLLKTDFKDCFDKNARRSSSVLVADRFLFDCGYHTCDSLRIAKADISKITDIFISHLHPDHFIAENVATIAKDRSIRLWCRRDAEIPPIPGVTVIHMERGVEYEVAPGVQVFAVDANHAESVCPQHYVLKINGKKIFYGCDGAWFLNPSAARLKNEELDFVILDATCGDYCGDQRMSEHNSIPLLRVMIPSLRTLKIIGDETEIYISHIAPSLHRPHDEIIEAVKNDGMKVAYDGLKLDI